MKKAIMLCLFTIPLLIHAQDEGYCPCQDEEKQLDEITQLINELNGQLTIYVPQTTFPVAIPVSMPKPPRPEPLRINVKPQKEEPIPQEKTEEKNPETKTEELDTSEEKRPTATTDSNRSNRTKIKKSRKRFKTRIKRKRKAKKYRGKCPAF